ncbi:MAG: succinylglutamate desuccinylase/aspartoacylase family protein [Burkholderiales bacterium]|nr:succinylglutamate desuccinylase/aspartoacylase family protein [Burkholderiales bacterium]
MTDPNAYTVEISPPDISPYRGGNTGIEYVTTLDSGKPGPHVMVTTLVHGNEICGAIVVDELFRGGIRPLHGRLTLAFCNVAAFERFDPANPEVSRWVDEDFNRLWTTAVLDGERNSTELRRARTLRPLIDSVDFLLDIHSMQHPSDPLLLTGPLAKGRELAAAIAYPALAVSDAGHAAGRRMRDYAAFGETSSPKNAMLVECGQHWTQGAVDVARETTLRFLAHFGIIDPRAGPFRLSTTPFAQQIVEVTHPVTIEAETFRFAQTFTGLQVIEHSGTLIGWDGDREVRTPYDHCVLVMPSKRLYRGQTAVRLGRFIVAGA